ncbi:hypothetical protein [uncultured Psychrobacter sp.]|uniref:hypothetical protein n=1 Tax=uncultured Psychrobacter sp. TaxID=259303 RepID=UPI002595BB0C|nr:hypothetical protein [uncultured Psychrobacter sp.]
METLRIESRDFYGNLISTLLIAYEYHDNGKQQHEDGTYYWEERASLVSAQIEVSDMTIPVSLNDELRAQYEALITEHTGLEIEGVAA